MIRTGSDLREVACSLFLHSVADCSIEQAFDRKVKRVSGDGGKRLLAIGEDVIDLDRLRRIGVVAVGKAAATMLKALLPYLEGLTRCDLSGVLIANEEPSDLPAGFHFFAGGHPTPNQSSVDGAEAAMALVRLLRKETVAMEDSLCMFLISGGASAMMELPLDRKISLDETVQFHLELVRSGASITEINCVRKHFSAVKGGRLALEAEGILSYSLFVSDVPLGYLDALGSGPTLGDTSTVVQCKEVLARYRLMERFPASIREFFLNQLVETPKPAQLRSRAAPLLCSDDLAAAAEGRARDLGFYTVVDNSCDDWSYDAAGEYLLGRLYDLMREHRRVCLISTGEVTVELPRRVFSFDGAEGGRGLGVGGRNQHFALYAASLLRLSDACVAVLSAGTDGVDGNSVAAGAVIDHMTLGNDKELLSRALESLLRFDSGTFFQDAGLQIITGATGNNLRDLRILLAAER